MYIKDLILARVDKIINFQLAFDVFTGVANIRHGSDDLRRMV